MTDEQIAAAQIALLHRAGRVSHVLAVDDTGYFQPRQLLQMCLSAGVESTTPLGDGRIAVNCPEGIPRALRMPAIQITEISEADVSLEEPSAPEGLGPHEDVLADQAAALAEQTRMIERLGDRLECLEFGTADETHVDPSTALNELTEVSSAILSRLERLEERLGERPREARRERRLLAEIAERLEEVSPKSDDRALVELCAGVLAVANAPGVERAEQEALAAAREILEAVSQVAEEQKALGHRAERIASAAAGHLAVAPARFGATLRRVAQELRPPTEQASA